LLTFLLTKDSGAFLGPIANILGILMNGIFSFWDALNIPNTGLSIITFTIIIYLCMLPLTIKQQKFSKLSAKMNPELTVIREKYKGKKDQASVQAMNTETQAVYAKYGVSQAGTCIQLIIQMPILFALYRVINNMPAYVTKIKEAFFPLVVNLAEQPGIKDFIQDTENFRQANMYNRNFRADEFINGDVKSEYVLDSMINVLNRASTAELNMVAETFPVLANDVNNTMTLLDRYNSFLGINIGNSPSFMFTEAWNGGTNIAWFALIGALIIPLLSAVTQWINVKLMPQQAAVGPDGQPNQMMQSMKAMNTMMPLMSAFFCFTLPAGMGLYWVAGAIVRSIQQVIINRHMDKIDLDELIKKNVEKRKKKMEKRGIDPDKVNTYANLNTRNVNTPSIASKANLNDPKTAEEKEAALKKATEYSKNAKPGSIAARANMVREYNESEGKQARTK
jgi:YidC/Oxa1 family membrane protein insertase